VHVKQIWSVARETHDRLGRLVWAAGWAIPLVAFGLAISIPYWRAMLRDSERAMAQQVGYEDEALCARFGFAAGTEKHFACKLDLLELRHSHARMLEANSLP
jgi:hypothetical protein